MSTILRQARGEEIEFLAWAMLCASRAHVERGAWDVLIGGEEAVCLEYLRRLAIVEPRSLYHYESFLVAEADGQPAAALCAFERSGGGWLTASMAMTQVEHDLGWTEADREASNQRIAPVMDCFLGDIGADWTIENVATRPEFRRRGLAEMLVRRVLEEGKQRGCRLAELSTMIGNTAAQSVYLKCGFRFTDEKRSAEMEALMGSPGFVRMVREL